MSKDLVLVVGLEGAGKTTLLHLLSNDRQRKDIEQRHPFNAVSNERDELPILILEIGGKEELRQYWRWYVTRALLLVFMVDSSNQQLFPVAKKVLHELLVPYPHLPLMVLANKQDVPGACSITDLHDALALSEVGDRQLHLFGIHLTEGEAELSAGVKDARGLIMTVFDPK